MRKALKWVSACMALSIAVFVASCDDSPTGAPDQAAVTPEAPATPSFDVVIGLDTLSCMGDEAADTTGNGGNTYVQGMGVNDPYDLNCTSNDVIE